VTLLDVLVLLLGGVLGYYIVGHFLATGGQFA
jgi:hypothetical protein